MAALRPAAVFVSAPSTERGQATVITSDAPGAQVVYGSNTLVIIRSVENPVVAKVYTQHQHPVTVARISPSGHYCASADKAGNLRIWATNNEDNTLKLEVKPLGGIITDLAWSPDGSQLLTTSADKTAKLWDARAGTLITTFNFADPKSIDYMQVGGVIAGRQLLSLGLNGDINYLSVDQPELPVRVIRGHSKPIQAVVVDHANERIISASNDGSFIRWTYQGQGERFQGKGHTSIPTSLALLEGGLLASAGMDDRVLLSSVDRLEFLPDAAAVKGGATGITAVPGQPHVLVAVTSAAVYVLREGKVVSQVAAANPVSVSAAPNGHVAVGTKGKDILIYNLEGDNLVQVTTLRGDHSAAINAVKYNAAGTLLATGDANRRITVWKAPEYTVAKDLIFHSGAIKSVAFSASDRFLVSGGLDSTVIVWDLEKDDKIVQQRAHHGGVTTVAFVNENTIVTGGMDACVRTWTLP